MKYFPIISCLFFLSFYGCNEVNPKGEKEVRKFVKQWSEDHTQLKAAYLERDYMDVVNYYGTERTRTEVKEDKTRLFEEFPDYTQSILNDQMTVTEEEGSFLVTFTKHVKYNGIVANYPSFLSVMTRNGVFKILREGVAKDAQGIEAPIFPKSMQSNRNISYKRQLFGDFNGDGLSDYASVISPEILSKTSANEQSDSDVVCEGACISIISFSAKDLKDITIEGAYRSQLENLKDLNGDGTDEIGFWDLKPKSKTLYVLNAATGTLLCEPIMINTSVHKNLNLIDVFKKTGPNKITITRSAQVDGKWVLQSQVIVLK